MGTTGLIYAAIAVAWLAYLVPLYLRRRDADPVEESDPAENFSDSMRIIRRGTMPLLDQDLSEIKSVEISTPLTRRAAIADLQRLEKQAASRRRRVLVSLMVALTAVVAVCVVSLIPWWSVAIPSGLLVGFVVVARFSVRAMRHSLDARFAAIGSGSDESTLFLSRKDLQQVEKSIQLTLKSDPAKRPGALWDPVPITLPTYVSKPLAPRTVRTIDLAGPDLTSSARVTPPVTADAPPVAEPVAESKINNEAQDEELRRAVGE